MSLPLPVDYFDGRSSRRHAATLEMGGGEIVLRGSFGERRLALEEIEVTEPLGQAPRVLRLASGGYCEVRDREAFTRWAQAVGFHAGHRVSAVMYLQSRWRWAVGSLAGVVLVVLATYLWVLPAVAARLAPALPPAFAELISETALSTLDGQLLKPSRLSAERQAAIVARTQALAAGTPGVPAYRVLFRSAPAIGANAFALPSGQIVVLDELVKLARDDDDVVAVVAHEIGHVAHFHGMRQLIQSAVVSFVAGAYLGDVSSLAASLSALVVESSYSREFEFEADRYGGRLLLAGGSSATRLGDMLLRLEMSHGAGQRKPVGQREDDSPGKGEGAPDVGARSTPEPAGKKERELIDYLSSHPDTQARIAALRELR